MGLCPHPVFSIETDSCLVALPACGVAAFPCVDDSQLEIAPGGAVDLEVEPLTKLATCVVADDEVGCIAVDGTHFDVATVELAGDEHGGLGK